MQRASCVLLLLALSSLAGCVSARPWAQAGEFRSLLECGMTQDAVLELAERFEGLAPVGPKYREFREATGVDPYWALALSPGGTSIVLGFKEDKLETVHLTWVSGVMQRSTEMRENLCSGEKAALTFLAVGRNSPFLGCNFSIDGVQLGRLSEIAGNTVLWIGPGDHLLRVSNDDDCPAGEIEFTIVNDLSKGDQYVVVDGLQEPET